jgi:hypothetical protein
MEVGFKIRGYKRVHIYTNPEDALDVAKFIAGSLLLSHGIRRDTVAVVRLKDLWLIAPGDRVRHLRPDEETLEGWVKAVLKGANLGVTMVRAKPSYEGYRVCLCFCSDSEGRSVYCSCHEDWLFRSSFIINCFCEGRSVHCSCWEDRLFRHCSCHDSEGRSMNCFCTG